MPLYRVGALSEAGEWRSRGRKPINAILLDAGPRSAISFVRLVSTTLFIGKVSSNYFTKCLERPHGNLQESRRRHQQLTTRPDPQLLLSYSLISSLLRR